MPLQRPDRVRIGIHQAEPGTGVTPEERVLYRDAGVGILVLPEYFWVRPGDRDHRDVSRHVDEDLGTMAELSREADWVVVGGTVIETEGKSLYNTCPVFQHGRELGRYRKIHLMPGEARHGVAPGREFVLIRALGLDLAPVVCADVLYPDTFQRVSALSPDMILAPMSSPYRPADSIEDKRVRDAEIFQAGAAAATAIIVKAGGIGSLFQRPLQGRSLVATPTEILFRTPFEEEGERRTWIVDVPIPPRSPSR